MKLGVFGGTFDPPHLGHLIAAQEVHRQVGLDRLLLVPAAVSPHKQDRAATTASIRVEMLRAAVTGDDRFEVSEIEVRREGPSYTVDTLRALAAEHPDAELFLALGSDQVAVLESWREPDAIARLARLVVFDRAGEAAVPADLPWQVRRVAVPGIGLSATEIRRRVGEGEPIRYMVPAPVAAIIDREGLYR